MKKSLNEELKRHMQIISYADGLDKVIEEKFKVTFQEQEPEVEPEEDGEVEIPDAPGATLNLIYQEEIDRFHHHHHH